MSRTSSPVPDSIMSEPYAVPEAQAIADTDVKVENEFAALGLNQKYPEVIKHLRSRQEFYRTYLPDGTAIATVPDAVAGSWWKCAATIIAEIEQFINIIEIQKDVIQRSRRR